MGPTSFGFADRNFLLNGEPFQIVSGELHPFRIPRPYWRHRLEAARAMGLNTVSIYCCWNEHEPRPGQWDFAEERDVAAFCRLAADLGLWVILRPGPYMCGEYDFGGLPWWLLKEPGIKVRCSDPRFLEASRRYLLRLGQHLAPLCCSRGGPIIMVQVENEYGAYGNDRDYLEFLKSATIAAGFDVQLFACGWSDPVFLRAGAPAGVPIFANFGSKAAEQLSRMAALYPGQPLFCTEFWVGWFDEWGHPRNGNDDPQGPLQDLRWILGQGGSVNLYLFHGGTSFGTTAGANFLTGQGYRPYVSSYDYWAPLNEAGRPTAKYTAFRSLFAEHQGRPLPDCPPPPLPTITLPPFDLTESASLWDNLPEPRPAPQPVPMEHLDFGSGLALYRTSIAGLGDQELRVVEPRDYACIFLNGQPVAQLDRRLGQSTTSLKDVPLEDATLDILVDSMGRVNFGPRLLDHKGITDRVEYGFVTLMGWEIFPIPFSPDYLQRLAFGPTDRAGPAFHRGSFYVEQPGDTFLDLRAWTRGVAWINGRCLGRFWRLGPQQTLYLPGCWLRPGRNDVLIFELQGSGRQPIQGLAEPILDAVAT